MQWVYVKETLDEMTRGRGPDRCIAAVGCEAHSHGSVDAVLDKAKKMVHLGTDQAHVLKDAPSQGSGRTVFSRAHCLVAAAAA